MVKKSQTKMKAGLTVILFLISGLIPTVIAEFEQDYQIKEDDSLPSSYDDIQQEQGLPPIKYDTRYVPVEDVSFAGEQNDIGYNVDVGDELKRSQYVFIGEPINQRIPGNGRTGTLDPAEGDECDCYRFTVCAGQTISVMLQTAENYEFELYNDDEEIIANNSIAEETGWFFLRIFSNSGAGSAEYTFDVVLTGQNDADLGVDAGDSFTSASLIDAGEYEGYLDCNDWEDWYAFSVSEGDGIFITIDPMELADFDIHLYNPAGECVHSEQYYGEDELEFPAEETGIWACKIDMFPGWNQSKWPDDYLLYGSGVYFLELTIGGSAQSPPAPGSQPDITPIAQTFIVNDDPSGNADEYGYLAAIPASNYLEGGSRYVSPIVYQGVDYIPEWFTSVDDTTGYLLDDWETYLSHFAKTSDEFIVDADPIVAAAEIATEKWITSDTAVVVTDGSRFSDESKTVFDRAKTLNARIDEQNFSAEDLQEIGGTYAAPMFIGPRWGALMVRCEDTGFRGDIGIATPRYESLMEDWWPFDSSTPGPDIDIYHPLTLPGFWFPYVTDTSGMSDLTVTKIEGDRFKIPVRNPDSSIKVTVTTEEPSHLIVYLIDPYGNIRRPSVPHWNGGEIKPIHQWMGGHWEHDYDDYRSWIMEPHTEHTVEVNYAMKGLWTAIVVPYYDYVNNEIGYNGRYNIKGEVRTYNLDRYYAGLSAANGAVLASQKHAPLLYVTEDAVPTETENALSQLGIEDIIFVNLDGISTAQLSGSVTEYTSIQEVVDAIKAEETSENYITITSFSTGDGYFAPAAMAAAYHGSPVLSICDAIDAYNKLDMLMSWREYDGDFYHGCVSLGHLPQMDHPFDLQEFIQALRDREFPSFGFDLKLRWFRAVNTGISGIADQYGLNAEGKEAYLFVSPRDTDIRDSVCRAMTGNNSYAGHIPVQTPGFASAIIVRNILYPALIYANPGRDVATSQVMNFPDGYQWRANDGKSYPNYATQRVKEAFSSHGRFYEGHSIWDNYLERMNAGAAISYYSGHGTGGSGISAQYKNIAEQFPLAEPQHENHYDFDWWDSWRGCSGYDNLQTKTARWRGGSSYNAEEPNMYDIVHFKWVDEAFDNLHSELEFWSSCTTGGHFGPIVYLSHGSATWHGNAGSPYGVHDDLYNTWIFYDVCVLGESIGESESKYVWLIDRDFTTCDPTTLYGRSTFFQGGLSNVHVLYGDPEMTLYNPSWVEPTPITP